MKEAIYAGSFDPWSFGHQFVLESALRIFDRVHVLAAVNPAKHGEFDSLTRTRAIAHSIDSIENWWKRTPPFFLGQNVIIAATSGLVVDYARENNILHLIRGLRSTSDFESEFNLYFSNRAIHSSIQTWCIMCPPELLHCSSTFVRSVVGQPNIDFVGTSFLNQAILLKSGRAIAHTLDIIQALSVHRFDRQPADLTSQTINTALQTIFLLINREVKNNINLTNQLEIEIENFITENGERIKALLQSRQYPESDVHKLWALLISAISNVPPNIHSQSETANKSDEKNNEIAKNWIEKISQSLGKTEIPLFSVNHVHNILKDAPL